MFFFILYGQGYFFVPVCSLLIQGLLVDHAVGANPSAACVFNTVKVFGEAKVDAVSGARCFLVGTFLKVSVSLAWLCLVVGARIEVFFDGGTRGKLHLFLSGTGFLEAGAFCRGDSNTKDSTLMVASEVLSFPVVQSSS